MTPHNAYSRVVVTKRTAYPLTPDQQGRPAKEMLGAANVERLGLKSAKVYAMPDDRRVNARPEEEAGRPDPRFRRSGIPLRHDFEIRSRAASPRPHIRKATAKAL